MLERFWRFGRPYAGRYAAGFVLLLAANAFGLTIPWLLRRVIDGLQEGGDAGRLNREAAAILGAAAFQAVMRTSSRLAILGASRRIVHDVRRTFFGHLQRLGTPFWDRQRTGDVMSRGVNDVQLLQAFYGPGLMNLLNTSIVYVAAWTLLFRIDAGLATSAMLVYPPLLFVVNRLSKRTYRFSMQVQETLAELSNQVQENLSGIQQVKTYVQEEREIARFRKGCATFRDRNLSMVRVRGAMMSVIGIASGMTTLLVLWLGGRHVIEGRISLGEFVAFNAYLAMLAWPTIALGWIINVFQRGAGSMRRLTAFLEIDTTVPLPPEVEPDPRPLGKLEVRGLTFAYAGEREPTIRDLSLTVGPGERVALVGEVGAGKSTLVQLISRLYEPPPGTIFLGGRDVLEIPLDELRRDLGVVPQESFLFSRTIRENVSLRRPQALDEELADAVERAHLATDLDRFPEGLETVVGERGVTLSGGQRQRVALARALMTGPSLLLLDDALSSVDSDTEQAILDRFLKGAGGRGCLFVSHRLSTLAGMDRIVVLKDGRVAEEGTHEALLANEDGAYRRLFLRRQIERSLEEGA